MTTKRPQVENLYQILYTPIVTVYVEKLEDGTFNIKHHVDCDFSDSFVYVHNAQTGTDHENTSEVLTSDVMKEVDKLVDSLALVEYYDVGWADENEPF